RFPPHAPLPPPAPSGASLRAAENAAALEARLERHLPRRADADVADPLVDRVRGRVREVRVEEAEAPAAVEQELGELGDEARRVAVPAELRRRVDRADPDPVRGAAARAGERHGLAAIRPDEEAAELVAQALVDHAPDRL